MLRARPLWRTRPSTLENMSRPSAATREGGAFPPRGGLRCAEFSCKLTHARERSSAMTRSRLFALILPAFLLPAAAWGRDDLCVFRKGLFLCDTAHDGGTAEMKFRFGRGGDIPFLIRS